MTNRRVERQAERILGDAMVSTPARRVCHDAGVELVTGRRRIAYLLGRCERQISRMVASGTLPATRAAEIPNAPLAVRADDISKVRS